MQQPPVEWLQQLDDILTASTGDAEADEALVARVLELDPDFLQFLIDRVSEQETSQSAGFLAALVAQSAAPEAIREHARIALDTLEQQGIHPPISGEEQFYAGYVTESRERGEQIMLLGWQMPDSTIEALVFLLDWRTDGVRDFYRTRSMTLTEWQQLLAHNSEKGGSLVTISPAEARTLIEQAHEVRKRFSRPEPREYRLERQVIERRLFDGIVARPMTRTFLPVALSAEEIVRAYTNALHHRDYTLLAMLLAEDNVLRNGHELNETIANLQAQMKHQPRREEEAVIVTEADSPDGHDSARTRFTVEGRAISVEKGGKRRAVPVRESVTLVLEPDGWRILSVQEC